MAVNADQFQEFLRFLGVIGSYKNEAKSRLAAELLAQLHSGLADNGFVERTRDQSRSSERWHTSIIEPPGQKSMQSRKRRPKWIASRYIHRFTLQLRGRRGKGRPGGKIGRPDFLRH